MASVVVVGGGLAGLTCAWRLQRAGHDVEVLEREARAGGRLSSETRRGFVLDHGGRFLSESFRNLHRVAAALGIERELAPLRVAGAGVLRDWEVHRVDPLRPAGLLLSGLLSAPARLRLARLAPAWWGGRGSRDRARASLGGESAAGAARRRLGAEGCEHLVLPLVASLLAADAQELCASAALAGLGQLGSPEAWESFAGGCGLLTQELARQVPLRTGCEVVSVVSETGGARVHYRVRGRESFAMADAAVLALPGSRVAALCPKLTPDERGFFEQVQYTSGVSVHLLLEQAPPELGVFALGLPRSGELGPLSLGFEHHKAGLAPPGAGLLLALLSGAAAARAGSLSHAELAGRVVEALAGTPVGRLRPVEARVRRWPEMLPRFEPGSTGRLARFEGRMDRSPRLAFAGDYLAGLTVEAALTSGMRAATQIERSL